MKQIIFFAFISCAKPGPYTEKKTTNGPSIEITLVSAQIKSLEERLNRFETRIYTLQDRLQLISQSIEAQQAVTDGLTARSLELDYNIREVQSEVKILGHGINASEEL